MVFLTTVLVAVVSVFASYGALICWKYWKRANVLDRIPCPKTLPFLGNALQVAGESDGNVTSVFVVNSPCIEAKIVCRSIVTIL